MSSRLKMASLSILIALVAAGCTTTESRLAGAGAGAAAGAVVAGPVGAAVGGVAGAVAGPTVARTSRRQTY
jgi:osmotically inducible lipoprotein OsmB